MKKKVANSDKVETISIYDVSEFNIGHEQDEKAITGCSVIICNKPDNLTSGASVKGGAPGIRNIDIFSPENAFANCQAVLLSGGSLFGLNAAGGVEKYLENKGIGLSFGDITLPVVSQAIIFDLGIGSADIRPDQEMAFQACINSEANVKYPDGNIGAGIGATLGGIREDKYSMKGGLGTYCIRKGPLYVGAIMVVNALGEVVNPATGKCIAGTLNNDGEIINLEDYIINNLAQEDEYEGNTTIGTVITNAAVTKGEAQKIAEVAHTGMARTIRPVHTMSDGDTMFTMATGEVDAGITLLEVMASRAVEQAILNAVRSARTLEEFKGLNE